MVAFTSSNDAALADAMLEAGGSRHFPKPEVNAPIDYIAGR
jgi:hypothetical protein